MTKIKVPAREEVSKENQAIFDNLKGVIGFVPNIYATLAHSGTALGNYLQFQNGQTSLSKKEKEVVSLVVSQENGCRYCQSAHSAVAKMNGFTDEEILEIRSGSASFDSRLDALVRLIKQAAKQKGHLDETTLKNFFDAGYNTGSLVDVVLAIGQITITNYLHGFTKVPIDFPEAPVLK